MPAPPEERGPAPSPGDGPPAIQVDFSDLAEQLKCLGTIPDDVTRQATETVWICDLSRYVPSGVKLDTRFVRVTLDDLPSADTITPAEAAEEIDDREAEELAKADAAEALADGQPGAKPTWGELFTSDEADRRFDLDFLDRVSVITSNFAKPTENQDGDTVYKLANVPDGVEAEIVRFLKALLKTGAVIARRYGENG